MVGREGVGASPPTLQTFDRSKGTSSMLIHDQVQVILEILQHLFIHNILKM